MKIAQVMLGSGFGGAERSFVDTTLSMAEKGHDVLAICHSEFIKIDLLQGQKNITVKTVSSPSEINVFAVRKIAKYIKEFQPEIIHTQLKRAAALTGKAVKNSFPIVSKLHNYVDLKKYKYTHTIVGTTEDQRQHALKQNWPEDRLTVIPNFSKLVPAEAVTKREGNKIQILSYGRFVHKKGFDVLMKALKKLLDDFYDIELNIHGQGDEEASLKALQKELAISGENLKINGWLDDISGSLDACDIFALPSRDEPFGIVMIEAMSRGTTLVSTKTQGPRQVLDDSNAYLVEIDDVDSLYNGLKSAIDNPEEAFKRASNGLQLYKEQYYKEVVVEKLEKLYKQVISNPIK